MNKKLLLMIILALVLVPIVAAQISESVKNALAMILDVSDNIDLIWIKAAILFVGWYLIFRSTARIIPNRMMASILALVVALIGARYMPEEWLGWMGAYAVYLLVIIVLLLPYFGGNILATIFRLGKGGKIFIVILFYVGFIYGLIKLEGLPIEKETLGILGQALDWIFANQVIALIIIAIILLIYIFRGGVGGAGGGAGGPGFFGGLGRGARGLAGRGAAGAAGARSWWQRRKMAAMLKSGQRQKLVQLERKMQSYKAREIAKKGGAQYAQYRREYDQAQRMRQKLKKRRWF